MLLQPKLLIADEPTMAIDSVTQYEVLEEFLRIRQEVGTAMIFISHDLGAISKVADRIRKTYGSHEKIQRNGFGQPEPKYCRIFRFS